MIREMIFGSDTAIDAFIGEQGCFNSILLVLLLVTLSVCYYAIILHISYLWRRMMKASDAILLCVAFVCGCVATYLAN